MRIGLKASQTKNMFEFPKQFGQGDGTEWNPLREGVFEDAAKIKIGVVGVSPGAGATFVASRIAYELARQADGVCSVEASQSPRLSSHSLSLSRIFKEQRFADYFGNWEQGLSAGCRTNLFENVNWVLRNPYEPNLPNAQVSLGGPIRLSAPGAPCGGIPYERIPGRYMVIDMPPLASLSSMDLVVCVIDPLPSSLLAAEETIRSIRENRIKTKRGFAPDMNHPTPCLWVLNKDNPKVSHRELERFMKIKFDFAVPMMNPEEFYRAEYNNMPVFKAIMRPGGEEADARKTAVLETQALVREIRKLLPIL